MTELNITSSLLEQLKSFDRLYIGFSGGVDSTVLLHFLSRQPELKQRLTAVHIHHGLSPNADAWSAHCQQVAQQFNVPFLSRKIKIASKSNIEEQARDLRFEAFNRLIDSRDALLLAQHQDDQAETVLLRLFRGTGINGAAAMAAERSLPRGRLIRPLLNCTRQELVDYAQRWQLSWVEDESNQSLSYDRNFLRQQIMPLIKQRWPSAVANITRFSLHCREAQTMLEEFNQLELSDIDLSRASLDLKVLENLSQSRRKLLIRQWLKNHYHVLPSSQLMQRIVNELMAARVDANPVIEWRPFQLRRYQNQIYLWQEPECLDAVWQQFPEPLMISSGRLTAMKSSAGFKFNGNQRLEIRFRKGGERFYYRGQHKSLKKLFQDWGLPPWLRDCWPLIYIDGQLAVVPDFAVSDAFYSHEGDNWLITYGQELTI